MALPGLSSFNVAALAAAPARELKVVDRQITKVIKTLNEELAVLKENEFPVKGHISGTSFGGGPPAPALAAHHARAHAVVVDTLKDLRKDLREFRAAVRDARELLRHSDEKAEGEFALVLARTEKLDLGAGAYARAQVTHDDDAGVN